MTAGADVERDVSLVIKTFERPSVLHRLVESVRRFYPRLTVIVVDDSAEPLDPVPEGVTSYCRLPFRSGAGHGRNVGLRHVETPYVLFADDDFVFGRDTDLAKMLRVLRRTRFDVVSCALVELDPETGAEKGVKWVEGTAEVEGDTCTFRYGGTRGYVDGYPVYDVLSQFFLADRARLGDDPWDSRLKIGCEHSDLFLTLAERGLLCTRLPTVSIYHRPEQPPGYAVFRADMAPSFAIFEEKRGIRRNVSVFDRRGRRDVLLHRYRRARSYAGWLLRQAV